MAAEDLIQRTIAARKAQGLSLRAYGAEGYTVEQPFIVHPATPEKRERYRVSLERRGYTVEAA